MKKTFALISFLIITLSAFSQSTLGLNIYMKGYKSYTVLPNQKIYIHFDEGSSILSYRKVKLDTISDSYIVCHRKKYPEDKRIFFINDIQKIGVLTRGSIVSNSALRLLALPSPLMPLSIFKSNHKHVNLKNSGWKLKTTPLELSKVKNLDRRTAITKWLE